MSRKSKAKFKDFVGGMSARIEDIKATVNDLSKDIEGDKLRRMARICGIGAAVIAVLYLFAALKRLGVI